MPRTVQRFCFSLVLCLLCLARSGTVTFAQPRQDQEEIARQAKAIFEANCYRCHGKEGAAEGGFNYLLDREKLIARKAVVVGNAAQSRLFKRVSAGTMPPEDEKPRPSEGDIAVLKRWIDAGAPDFNPSSPKRYFISPEAVLKAMRKDLEGLDDFDRKFTRYFTLAHLHNAGLSEDQLQTYRLALSKLVNSLSWGRRVVVPSAIDPAKTVFRIDLRHYGWNEKVWDRVVASHPYGVIYDTDAAMACSSMAKCRLPYVRGDWFVSAAAKPPLYHHVLQLPSTDKELERQLRVDVEENIRQRLVQRSGFGSSGVSQNNRLIERHESANGAYWKSYDFAGSADRQNLFIRPLGPNVRSGFQPDGGEIIFSLPNGLQGYMLVDAKGNRIEKGPTAVVSDPKRPDRAVVNGLSCMSCHNQGTIEKDDEVRKHVLANKQSFTKEEAETILAIYPPSKKLKESFKEDAERFARGVEKAGGRLDQNARVVGTDPVVALAALFEQDVDMKLAAAEIGIAPTDLAKALDRSPKLSRALGQLKADGGSVKRDAFVSAFRGIIGELELGVYVSPDVATVSSQQSVPGTPRQTPDSEVASAESHFGDLVKDAALLLMFEEDSFKKQDGRGNVLDQSKPPLRGLLKGAHYTPFGKLGGGLEFDGKASLEVSDAGLPAGNAQRTVVMWVKSTGTSPTDELLFWYGRNEATDGVYLPVLKKHGGSRISVGNPGGGNEPVGSRGVKDGEWHHIALVYDGRGQASLYVDSNLDVIAKRPYSTKLTGSCMIGGSGGAGFVGIIDEFAILKRALTKAEIAAIIKQQSEPPKK